MMESRIYVCVCFVLTFPHLAVAGLIDCADPAYGWTATPDSEDLESVRDFVADGDGNIIICGLFSGTVDLDPTEGEDTRTATGPTDAFVTKLRSDGSYAWSVVISGDIEVWALSVVPDSAGNLLVGGGFTGTVDFDAGPGEDIRSAESFIDGYVTKLGADGTYQWTWTFGSGLYTFGVSFCESLAVDERDNVLATGSFLETVDFDPGEKEDNHTSVGGLDIFVTKLGPNGEYLWTDTFGGEKADIGQVVTVDGDGNVIVTGHFGENSLIGYMVDFDPTEGEDWQCDQGGEDIFVTKLDSDGSYEWTATMGGLDDQRAHDIGTDAEGNVFVTGYFKETVDFDPSEGEDIRTSVLGWWCGSCFSRDIFVNSLAADGAYRWTATIGDDTDDEASALAVDGAGNVVLTGKFGRTVDFDPTDGVDIHDGGTNKDVYITVLQNDGSYGWTQTLGGSGLDFGEVLALDPFGDIIVGGTFEGTVDFDPTEGVDEHTAIMGSDYFVTKLLCSEPLPCAGDANGDGRVDPLDGGFVLSRLGCEVGAGDPDCDAADQNGDSAVDPLDVGFILSRFGGCD